jgi:hypothetical protein
MIPLRVRKVMIWCRNWLEADQAELTLLHHPEAEGALKATAYRFCASRQSLEPTGAVAFVPFKSPLGLEDGPSVSFRRPGDALT